MARRKSPDVVKIFYCYAHEDEYLQGQLSRHLSNLKRQGLISDWHYRDIRAGQNWRQEIDEHLNTAHIVLLLVSANFMNSDYCHCIEMMRALERHRDGETKVIPIMLKSVDVAGAPFSALQMLPRGQKAVASSNKKDQVWTDITIELRKIIFDILGRPDPVDEAWDDLGLTAESPRRSRSTRAATPHRSNRGAKGRTSRRGAVQTLSDTAYRPAPQVFRRSLPNVYNKTFLEDIWSLIIDVAFPGLGEFLNDNLNAKKYRRYRKGIRAVGYFFFFAFDVCLITYGVSSWLHSPVLTIVTLLISLLLFVWMSLNEHTLLSVVFTLIFACAWCSLGTLYFKQIEFIVIFSVSLFFAYLRLFQSQE